VTIQTPDPYGPGWNQREAEAAAAGLAKAVQSSATGLANVSGRFPHLGAGHVELDEGQISELIEDLNRAAS
jgi:hypothetical protein